MAAHHERLDLRDGSLLREGVGFIANDFVPAAAGKTFDVVDPTTELVWARAAEMDAGDAERAVAAAKAAFPAYSRIPARLRAERLLKLHGLVHAATDDLAQLVVLENGKPLAEARAEVGYALTFLWWMAGEAERVHGQTVSSGTNERVRYLTVKRPIGVCFLAVAYNFSVALLLRKLATALAAGCTCIVKPSPETPLTALAIAELTLRAGYEPGVVNVLPASLQSTPPLAKYLCEAPDVRKISYTGSTRVGALLVQQSAQTLTKLTLELGGNGAFVVYDDADLDAAVAALMASKWRASGQACITANRTYVQRGIAPAFFEAFAAAMRKQLCVGPGLVEGTTLGPLTTRQAVERAQRHVDDAVRQGAKLVLGGRRPPDRPSGFWFEPTLLVDVPPTAAIMAEETFSPVATIATFDTEDEVTALVNATEYGLTNYVFTRSLDRAFRAIERFESGTVGVNIANPTCAESPFGGVKSSGYGKEAGIGAGIDEYLVTKTAALSLDI